MAEDWASKIRESIQSSNKAMDLYRRQTQAGMMNAQSGGTTRYTAIENGGITDVGSFTPAPAGMSAGQFSGGPIESASFYGSGQINETGPPPDSSATPAWPSTPVWGTPYEGGQGGGGGGEGPPTPSRRPRRPSTPMKKHYMGSAGGGGLSGFAQNQRNASSWENLQRRSNYMPPNQQTPRQRFTA